MKQICHIKKLIRTYFLSLPGPPICIRWVGFGKNLLRHQRFAFSYPSKNLQPTVPLLHYNSMTARSEHSKHRAQGQCPTSRVNHQLQQQQRSAGPAQRVSTIDTERKTYYGNSKKSLTHSGPVSECYVISSCPSLGIRSAILHGCS